MADITVLERTGNTWQVAMHFDIPLSNNAAGASWPQAVTLSGFGGTTVMQDGNGLNGTILVAERVAIEAGTVIERVTTMDVDGFGATDDSRREALQAKYAEIEVQLSIDRVRELDWFGHTESKA